MKNCFVSSLDLSETLLWKKLKETNKISCFELEITARCNNNCRHCYINLPANDLKAKKNELSFEQIKLIVDQAIAAGALWCLISGGEPLLRKDFFDIYLYLKKRGLLVSIFTNATLVTKKHIDIFKKYPPRDIEVTVYGVTKDAYEQVSRIKGSFNAFMRGLNLLLKNKIKVRLKAMVIKSNFVHLAKISSFCRSRTKDYFRFDPFLHLRYDGDKEKNKEIKLQRLTPKEIVKIEQDDLGRNNALREKLKALIVPEFLKRQDNRLFNCGTGCKNFVVSPDGIFRLCSSLWHPDCVYDLKKIPLTEAINNLIPKVRMMCSGREAFLKNCRRCEIMNLCFWCPANAYLETKRLDSFVKYFCQVAKERRKIINEN